MRGSLMLTTGAVTFIAGALLLDNEPRANAHCQIPCGIYDDAGRIKHLLEDTETITKAMTNIRQMAGNHDPQSVNQATRWVIAKEEHAAHIISVVAEYFLTQKVKDVKPGTDGYQTYLEMLAIHHRVMRAAMKAKQSVDAQDAEDLKQSILLLRKGYPPAKRD